MSCTGGGGGGEGSPSATSALIRFPEQEVNSRQICYSMGLQSAFNPLSSYWSILSQLFKVTHFLERGPLRVMVFA